MIAVKPADITRAKLVTTNAPDQPLFDPGATYATGAVVRVGDEAFRSIADANTGHPPATSPLWWDSLGACNQLAMFDTSPTTPTIGPVDAVGNPMPLVVGFRPGIRCSAIGLLRVLGASAVARVYTDQGGTLLHEDSSQLVTSFGTYYSWCFEALQQTPDIVFWDIAATNNPYIEITITPARGIPAQIGVVVAGRQTPCGKAEYGFQRGAELRGRSYINKQGNPVRLDRGFRKTVSGTLIVNNRGGVGFPMEAEVSYNRVNNFLDESIGVPMLWVLDKRLDDYRSAVIFGDYERTSMSLNDHFSSKLSIDINGYF